MLIDDQWDFWFSFLGALGSAATAAAFGVIIYQTRLNKKQIAQTKDQIAQTQKQVAQTQEELDNTLRPWLGVLQTKEQDIIVEADYTDAPNPPTMAITVQYFLKNYGRVPARVTSKRYKWSKNEISKNELYSEKIPADWSSSRLQSLLLPGQDGKSTVHSRERSFLVSLDETFYFGLLIDYDFGEGTRKREYGTVFEMKKPSPLCLYSWTT
jgi:hypothetical protein